MAGKIIISTEQALNLLSKEKQIHTFRQAGMCLIGADWSRKDIVDAIKKNTCELGGPQSKSLGHALVINTGGHLFVEVDTGKVEELELSLKEYGKEHTMRMRRPGQARESKV